MRFRKKQAPPPEEARRDERAAVTVFGVTDVAAQAWDALEARGLDVAGDTDDQFRASDGAGTLTFNIMRQERGGDEFSRLVLGAIAHATHHWPDAERLVALLEDSEIILGVPADPPLTIGDRRWQAVLEVAGAVDGLVFDGFDYYRPDGLPAT